MLEYGLCVFVPVFVILYKSSLSSVFLVLSVFSLNNIVW